jgi:hypothetical protein
MAAMEARYGVKLATTLDPEQPWWDAVSTQKGRASPIPAASGRGTCATTRRCCSSDAAACRRSTTSSTWPRQAPGGSPAEEEPARRSRAAQQSQLVPAVSGGCRRHACSAAARAALQQGLERRPSALHASPTRTRVLYDASYSLIPLWGGSGAEVEHWDGSRGCMRRAGRGGKLNISLHTSKFMYV